MSAKKMGLIENESTSPQEARDTSIIPADVVLAINRAHGVATAAAKNALTFAMEAGRLLSQASESVPHGQWATWLAAHCPEISERTDRLYRRLYEQRGRIESASDPIKTIGEATRFLGQGQQTAKPPSDTTVVREIAVETELDIEVAEQCQCGCNRWMLTDGGQRCEQCGAERSEIPMPPTTIVVAARTAGKEHLKAVNTAYGKLVRAIDNLGHNDLFEPLLKQIQAALVSIREDSR